MKTFLTSFFICRFVRRRIADEIDRGDRLDDRDRDHIAQCPVCRRHFEVQSNLVAGLRRQASRPVYAVDPAVRERILGSIAENPGFERPVVFWRILLPASGAVLAALMGVVFFVLLPAPEDEPVVQETFPAESIAPVETLMAETRIDAFDGDVYLRERDHLIADGRATARFFLSSFPVDVE